MGQGQYLGSTAMRETDMRPAALIDDQLNCVEQDRRFLLEQQDEFVRSDCPPDLVRAAHRLLRPRGLLVVSCPNIKGFDVAAPGTVSDSRFERTVFT
jgi:hypothetical protein